MCDMSRRPSYVAGDEVIYTHEKWANDWAVPKTLNGSTGSVREVGRAEEWGYQPRDHWALYIRINDGSGVWHVPACLVQPPITPATDEEIIEAMLSIHQTLERRK